MLTCKEVTEGSSGENHMVEKMGREEKALNHQKNSMMPD